MRRFVLLTTVLFFFGGIVAQGWQKPAGAKPRKLSVEIFQVLGLPLNIHEAALVEKDAGFLLRCRVSSEASNAIVGVRYSLTLIDPENGAQLLTNRTEGFALSAYESKTFTFATPIKFKPRDGCRLVLMLEQVVSPEAIWEVIKAKDALDAYVKGDFSIQPNVMRVANQVDAPLQIRVIN